MCVAYAPVILARKAKRMSETADAEKVTIGPLRTVFQKEELR